MYASAADYLVYIGFIGMAIVFFLLMYFLVKRLAWIFGILFGMSVGSPNYKSGVIKFIVLLLLLMGFGALTYVNFYIRAYPSFKPNMVAAEVYIYQSTGNYSSISISIQRDETHKTLQGAAIQNGPHLLLGEVLRAPEWMRSFGVTDGFRFYGVLKGAYTSNYIDKPIDINVAEKPGNLVWGLLVTIQEILPIAEIDKHYINFIADGYNDKFNVYVAPEGFTRD